ncbi:hypothetical protein CHGG_04214 [Chaetomium globosum CBS 148.51]|uniref:Uncharacterized protein n=1 Tax=Chaetomium globosum (strain ATCC 6205 / CBS 148.51 / DSM 1962 / NBRC 6347 / NRRL 1970) TaxID=306901 RepID=Q2H1Y2_CHAGB|nr:uncharacterized protein CHGG_04214 [Chaetomium globosum CBS 148.51]EAQ87595.1 hypothetical protein CHGG_04214 [Chaetomium globosum CBS 148.51]
MRAEAWIVTFRGVQVGFGICFGSGQKTGQEPGRAGIRGMAWGHLSCNTRRFNSAKPLSHLERSRRTTMPPAHLKNGNKKGLVHHAGDKVSNPQRERQEDDVGQQEGELKAHGPVHGQGEEVGPVGDGVGLAKGRAGPAGGVVEAVAEGADDGPVDEVERVRDAAEELAEARLEEAPQPGNARDARHDHVAREEEVEPLVVEDGLRVEERQVVPPPAPPQVRDLPRPRRHAGEEHADDEEVVVDEGLVWLQSAEPPREVAVLLCEQVQVALQHAGHEQRAVVAVDDVEEVVGKAEEAEQPSLVRRPRQRHAGHVNHHRPPHLQRNGPEVGVGVHPRPSLLEEEAEVLELDVPVPDLFPDRALGLGLRGPETEQVPRHDVGERGHDDGDIEPEPSAEEGGRKIVEELEMLTRVDEG